VRIFDRIRIKPKINFCSFYEFTEALLALQSPFIIDHKKNFGFIYRPPSMRNQAQKKGERREQDEQTPAELVSRSSDFSQF